MLEKSIFFVSKQPVLIEISDIHQVVFSRVGAGIATARTFDMQIITKLGPEYAFTSINKEEHELTDTYLKEKKVRVKNEMVPDGDLLLAAAGDDSDEEMQSVASDDDEEPRVRRTGDDDDDSEDGKSKHNVLPSQEDSRPLTHTRTHACTITNTQTRTSALRLQTKVPRPSRAQTRRAARRLQTRPATAI
jgi:structure-specific recognition protein 1